MRILYITTIGLTMRFFVPFITELVNQGHTVEIACNDKEQSEILSVYRKMGCKIHSIDTSRSPFSKGNLNAVKQIRQLTEQGHYDIVHCHTPIAAACTRIGCRSARKKGTKVVYTAHGFHFYKGAPAANWMIYYPVEKLCAHFTDLLLTMNQEDYRLAMKKMKASRVEYVPGVGIDLSKVQNVSIGRTEKRSEMNIDEQNVVLLSVGELNTNKNQSIVIRALAQIKNPSVHYYIAGIGEKKEELARLAEELSVSDRVHFLGYRNDVFELMRAADIFLLPSIREGLNVSLMEAMASGLPCICSDIRGNSDLIDENKGGNRVPSMAVEGWKKCISRLADQADMRKCFGAHNKEKIQKYSTIVVNRKMHELYKDVMSAKR